MMPKVIGNDSLIARVNEVQGCMYRQSNELGRLNKAVRRYKEENAKLWEILKSLMMGTNAELCAGRGESDCKECSMYHGEDGCTVVNAMELLGIDMYGESLGIEVE